MSEHFDTGSIWVIAVTLVLFAIAPFSKGFTHDLLLEAAIFLVSVKLIMMAYKNSVATKQVNDELAEIKAMLLQQR